MIDDVAARGFEAAAAAYERGRPGYPEAAVAFLERSLELGPGRTVLDLAAGTGKLTRHLPRTGARVVAVEPVAAMRSELRTAAPTALVVAGTAERLPLADGCLDAAVVAQAFHWFDAELALAELARVVRPGGGLALAWNVRDARVPWVAGLSELLQRHRGGARHYLQTDWPSVVAAARGWSAVRSRRFEHEHVLSRELLLDRVASVSFVAALPEADRRSLLDEVLGLVADQPDTFPLPYLLDVQVAHRVGRESS